MIEIDWIKSKILCCDPAKAAKLCTTCLLREADEIAGWQEEFRPVGLPEQVILIFSKLFSKKPKLLDKGFERFWCSEARTC